MAVLALLARDDLRQQAKLRDAFRLRDGARLVLEHAERDRARAGVTERLGIVDAAAT